MPFQDPAIMSFRSSQQQQQQQQQQHPYSNNTQQQHGSSNNNQFSSDLGMHGVGGTTDPSSLGAFAAFASQSLNVGNARLLQQIQHQQQQQGYYGVQQGGQGGRGPSPSPPLASSTPIEEANVFDFPPLPPGLPRPATTSTSTASTLAARFISNQATPASKTPSSPSDLFTPSDSEPSSNSTPLRPTEVQIAVQSATPNFSVGSPGAEWSNVWGESPSRSRSSLLGAQGWTPGVERRLSLEAIEGRMSKEEEERVEDLVGEHDGDDEVEVGLRAEEEEVEREMELLVVEEIIVVEEVVVAIEEPVVEPEPAQEEVASTPSTSNVVTSSSTRTPDVPVAVSPTPHPDEVRAAVRAASADRPAPVTISLRSKPIAAPTPPPVEKAVVVEKTPTSNLKSASVKSTPTSTRPGTPTKAGKGTPKQQIKVGTAVVAEPSPSKTPKLVAKSSSSSVVSAVKVQQVNTPPPPAPAAPVFVEQAPLLSKMAKKAKVPKVKKLQEVEKENSPSTDGEEPTAANDDASSKSNVNGDQPPPPLGPSSCGANEILVPTSSLDALPEPKPIASLPEILHQISYLIDCNSLAFFSPSLPCISLPSTESTDESNSNPDSTPLSSQTLALALSALSSSNPTVSMEEAVSSFHVLLSLLTGRIAGVLGALPTGCRGGVSGRFEGMFGEGGEAIQTDGFDELDDDDEEEEANGVEGEIVGGGGRRGGGVAGDEVERLRSALGRRASYLAKQLGRLEELHREINVVSKSFFRFCSFHGSTGFSVGTYRSRNAPLTLPLLCRSPSTRSSLDSPPSLLPTASSPLPRPPSWRPNSRALDELLRKRRGNWSRSWTRTRRCLERLEVDKDVVAAVEALCYLFFLAFLQPL
ncbi:hypothetical protein BDY24DRAFT_404034 [Mrakia frigida]|uniref:uncharacterized protein n=1 Tax=Mrakia frigida TaxID=29902 RepID=UPI003FCC23ED